MLLARDPACGTRSSCTQHRGAKRGVRSTNVSAGVKQLGVHVCVARTRPPVTGVRFTRAAVIRRQVHGYGNPRRASSSAREVVLARYGLPGYAATATDFADLVDHGSSLNQRVRSWVFALSEPPNAIGDR
jgi:hypothetical protein